MYRHWQQVKLHSLALPAVFNAAAAVIWFLVLSSLLVGVGFIANVDHDVITSVD